MALALRLSLRRACSACGAEGHEADARCCRRRAAQLAEEE